MKMLKKQTSRFSVLDAMLLDDDCGGAKIIFVRLLFNIRV